MPGIASELRIEELVIVELLKEPLLSLNTRYGEAFGGGVAERRA